MHVPSNLNYSILYAMDFIMQWTLHKRNLGSNFDALGFCMASTQSMLQWGERGCVSLLPCLQLLQTRVRTAGELEMQK